MDKKIDDAIRIPLKFKETEMKLQQAEKTAAEANALVDRLKRLKHDATAAERVAADAKQKVQELQLELIALDNALKGKPPE